MLASLQMFVMVLFWFQLYNGFSGSNAIDDLSLIFFNLLFTAAPPIVCGVLDKDVPHYILTARPALYKSGQNGEVSSAVCAVSIGSLSNDNGNESVTSK